MLSCSPLTLQEVWFQVNIEDVSAETLDGVIKGENVDAFAIFDIWTLVNDCDITQFHSEVISGDFVHLDLSLFNIIGTENDEDGIAPLLSAVKVVNRTPNPMKFNTPDDDGVPSKELQRLHRGRVECGDCTQRQHTCSIQAREKLTRVVIGGGLIYNETMGTVKNGIRSVAGHDEREAPYDFFVRKIAVAVSFGPGWGGAPLGSAIVEVLRCW